MATRMTERPSPSARSEEGTTAPTATSDYEARYQRARKRVEDVRGFYIHLTVYLVVNLFLFAINMLTDSGSLWFYWPLLGWGAGVAIHGLMVLGPLADRGAEWEERKIREYMEKDR